MEITVLPEAQRDILRHALGLDRAKGAYRNSYVTGPDCDGFEHIVKLVAAGYMERRMVVNPGQDCYFVTELGKAVVVAAAGQPFKVEVDTLVAEVKTEVRTNGGNTAAALRAVAERRFLSEAQREEVLTAMLSRPPEIPCRV